MPADANTTECVGPLLNRYNGSMSAMLMQLVPYAVYTSRALIPVWVIIGVPGSVLSFLVWSSRFMRSSSSIYLSALAILDCIFLLLVQFPYYLYLHYEVKILRPGPCHALPAINMWLQYLSPLLTLGFTIERYISICHPFSRDKLCTVRRALIVVGCMTAACLAMGLVQVNFYQYGEEGCSEDPRIFNSTTVQSWVFNVWTKSTEVLFFALAPLSILLFNTLVLVQARRVMEKQVGGSRQSKGKSAATTATLLTVSFYQIGAVLPVTILLFIGFHVYSSNLDVPCDLSDSQLMKLPKVQLLQAYLAVNKIVESLSVSHYAMKFFIYLLTGRIFRKQLLVLLNSCLPCLSGFGGLGAGIGTGEFQLPVHRTSEERRRWRRRQNGGDFVNEEGDEESSSQLALMAGPPLATGNGEAAQKT